MLKRLLLLPLLAALPILVQVMGCTGCERLEETSYGVGRGGGVMNDSMALLPRYVTNYYFTDGLGGGERYEGLGYYLLLVDIRHEKIYWEKEIPSIPGVFLNTIQDSVLFFLKTDFCGNGGCQYISEIAFQVLDDKMFQVSLKPKKIDLIGEGWEYTYEVRVRPWKDGLILANSRYADGTGNGNHYALLDTATGTMELWQPAGEFEWLNECTDAKWSKIGGLCLKEIPDTLGFVLLRNGVDTLAVRYMPHKLLVELYGNSRRLFIFSGNGIISWGWVYLMSGQGQVSESPLDIWIYQMGTFRDLHGNEVDYNKKIIY